MNEKIARFLIVVVPLSTIPFLAGCRAPLKLRESGFLSDYSKLEVVSDHMMRYMNPRVVPGTYSGFIVDRVEMNLEEDREGYLTEEQVEEITEYIYAKLTKTIAEHDRVVSRPGPGVARIRIAITDVRKSKPLLNILPSARLVGTGRGGAVIEGEVVDSQTGDQIIAVIRRRRAGFVSSRGTTALSDVKHAIDRWMKEIVARVTELRAAAAAEK